jgi:hypothetical protein
MKFPLSILFFCFLLLSDTLTAQDLQNIVFKYRCVPTSTSDLSIEITMDKFILNKNENRPGKNGRIKNVASSNYTHTFNSKERETLNSIIKVNKLDSVGLYHERKTEWGSLWEVEIQRNSITYNIDLPNYNNAGLEALIHFIHCLIPKKEMHRFACKKCSLNDRDVQ